MNSVMFLILLTRSRPHTPQCRLQSYSFSPAFLFTTTRAHRRCDYLSVCPSACLLSAVVAVFTHALFHIPSSHFGNNAPPYTHSASLSPHVPPIHHLRTQRFPSPSSHRLTFFPFYGRKKGLKTSTHKTGTALAPPAAVLYGPTPITYLYSVNTRRLMPRLLRLSSPLLSYPECTRCNNILSCL
ncbi:hypothetical protein EDB89DRAFT_449851 [Lactarius sanguifluus]|nr:hypothetical protein EDB89DRAFT_449851 [Lactarius sanguifluus]